jgi:competence protein ComGC
MECSITANGWVFMKWHIDKSFKLAQMLVCYFINTLLQAVASTNVATKNKKKENKNFKGGVRWHLTC